MVAVSLAFPVLDESIVISEHASRGLSAIAEVLVWIREAKNFVAEPRKS